MIGRRIGRFRIMEKLGQGGMATVWKARDELLGREVAVKLLAEDLAGSDEARRRFRREGEVAALLEHPWICPVYEAGEDDGVVYLVMALVDGATVSARARQRLMPIDDVLQIGMRAAEALAHAHARGVVHRDVTGRNIMLARDGRVMLLDFGLAIVADSTRITGPGAMLGTIAYMAPELLLGEDATPQSDLYGLGVVLYEALTGSLPFQAGNPEALRFKVLGEAAAPPRALRPEIQTGLDEVVRSLLERDAAKRVQDAAELQRHLQTCVRAMGPSGRRPPGRGRAHARWRAAGPEADTERQMRPLMPGASVEQVRESSRTTAEITDLAGRISKGAQLAFLLVLDVEDGRDGTAADPAWERLLKDLGDVARATLASVDRVRVVPKEGVSAGANLKDVARTTGANIVLTSMARLVGTHVRVVFALVDPESGTRVAGSAVEGSTSDPFALEDRFVRAVQDALGRRHPRHAAPTGGLPDPALEDRLAQARAYLQRFDQEATLDGAIAILERLRASDGDSVVVMSLLARACLARFHLTHEREWRSRAVSACENAVALEAYAPDAMLASAEIHLDAGRLDQALAELDRVLEARRDDYDALLVRARLFDALGRPADAEADALRAANRRPHDWRAYHTLGMINWRIGRFARAAETWREAVRLCPDNASAHRNLGSAYAHMDRLDDAIEAFRRSLELHPNSMAYYNLGTVLFFKKQYEECVEAFEHAVALNPSDPVTWGNLGNACRFIRGKDERMREALARAIALGREHLTGSPSDADKWSRIGGWLSNLGENEEAIAAVEKSLTIQPHDVRCMLTAGHVYLNAGDRERAIDYLESAVERGLGTELLQSDPELEPLRGDPRFQRMMERGARKSVQVQTPNERRPQS